MQSSPSRDALASVTNSFQSLSISEANRMFQQKAFKSVKLPKQQPSSPLKQLHYKAARSPARSRSLAAAGGLGRKDVAVNDIDCSKAEPRRSPKKNKAKNDRYIPHRTTSSNDHTGPINTSMHASSSDVTEDLQHTAELSSTLGVDGSKRILSFFAEPPPAQAEHAGLLSSYTRPAARAHASAASAAAAAGRRKIATAPERILDAPGLIDDYYLNLMDWSVDNLLAIGLTEILYIWNAESGVVSNLCSVDDKGDAASEYVSAVKFSEDGSYVGVGASDGSVQIFDVARGARIRTMRGHNSRVSSLSWSGAILSSGSKAGGIINSDVRIAQHKVSELNNHRGEVCGLAWRPEAAGGLSGGGQGLLASGGNDNVVNVWDGRMPITPKMSKTNHLAAVKALAWCPWQSSLLASGGGSSDKMIHFWNVQTGARLNSIQTPSQVTSLIWNPYAKEIMSSHGIPDYHLSIWGYPTLNKVADITNAHDARILHSALSPDGTTVATASSDENLKFWKLFESRKKGSTMASRSMMGAKDIDNASGLQKKTKTSIVVR